MPGYALLCFRKSTLLYFVSTLRCRNYPTTPATQVYSSTLLSLCHCLQKYPHVFPDHLLFATLTSIPSYSIFSYSCTSTTSTHPPIQPPLPLVIHQLYTLYFPSPCDPMSIFTTPVRPNYPCYPCSPASVQHPPRSPHPNPPHLVQFIPTPPPLLLKLLPWRNNKTLVASPASSSFPLQPPFGLPSCVCYRASHSPGIQDGYASPTLAIKPSKLITQSSSANYRANSNQGNRPVH